MANNRGHLTEYLYDDGSTIIDKRLTASGNTSIYYVSSVAVADKQPKKGHLDRPYGTIQAALTAGASSEQALIDISPGVYNENLSADNIILRIGYGVTINGTISGKFVKIYGDGTGIVNGAITGLNEVKIYDIDRIVNTTADLTINAPAYLYISRVRQIEGTNTTNIISGTTNNTSVIKDVDLIRQNGTGAVFFAFKGRLANCESVESVGSYIDAGFGYYSATNCNFKSTIYNFKVRNSTNKFKRCSFKCTTNANFVDNVGCLHEFKNCEFISGDAVTYAVETITGGITRLHLHFCTTNKGLLVKDYTTVTDYSLVACAVNVPA